MPSKSALRGKTGVPRVYSYNNWAPRSFFLKQSSQGLTRKKKKDCFPFDSTSISHIFASFLSTCAHAAAKGREGWNGLGYVSGEFLCSKGEPTMCKILRVTVFGISKLDKLFLITGRFCTKHGSWFAFETCLPHVILMVQGCFVVLFFFFLKGR